MESGSRGSFDYERLLLRLTAHAARFLNACQNAQTEKVVHGAGLSPEDFAIQVIEMLARGDLEHDASKGTLIRHLTVVMERDILDALDRAEHKRVDFVDPVAVQEGDEATPQKALADFGDKPDEPAVWLDGDAFKNRIYSLVQNHPDLKEMAVAIFEVNALKPREIAEVCLTTTADIQNRKKRFGRLLEEHGITRNKG